jgi:hypothetical protein
MTETVTRTLQGQVAKLILQKRREAALKQKELGALLGHDPKSIAAQAMVSDWERGVRPIYLESAQRRSLAKFLGLTEVELNTMLRKDATARKRWSRRNDRRMTRPAPPDQVTAPVPPAPVPPAPVPPAPVPAPKVVVTRKTVAAPAAQEAPVFSKLRAAVAEGRSAAAPVPAAAPVSWPWRAEQSARVVDRTSPRSLLLLALMSEDPHFKGISPTAVLRLMDKLARVEATLHESEQREGSPRSP